MSETSIEEYTEKMRELYTRMTGRKPKSNLLDKLITLTGLEHNHTNKVLAKDG